MLPHASTTDRHLRLIVEAHVLRGGAIPADAVGGQGGTPSQDQEKCPRGSPVVSIASVRGSGWTWLGHQYGEDDEFEHGHERIDRRFNGQHATAGPLSNELTDVHGRLEWGYQQRDTGDREHQHFAAVQSSLIP